MRSRGVFTLHSWIGDGQVGEKIQIVLRLYASPAEVLVGFDCGCCCCAYDGREVWVTPRCVYSLQKGVNVLNPLHSWPNKTSYEMRLAKYATRGFPVAAPGLDAKRIDYDNLRRVQLRSLKGLARLLKIAFDMEASFYVSPPKLPIAVDALRAGATEILDPCEDAMRGSGYDDSVDAIFLPEEYRDGGEPCYFLWHRYTRNDYFRVLNDEIRRSVWRQIEEAGEDAPKGVPSRLNDAWDKGKRSREYLNATMDKDDLDSIYYDHAYKK